MNADVRRATTDDLAAVERIVGRAYGHYVSRIGRAPGPMLDDYGALIDAGRVHVAERVGGVAGVLVLIPEQDALLLDNIAVDPSAQGSGLGRRLLEFAEAAAQEAGYAAIRLYTHEAMTENIGLYGRFGYVETHRGEEKGYKRVYMTKALGGGGMGDVVIDAGRLWSDLMTMASIGALPLGGCDRLALTDADAAGRHLFAHWCREAGLALTVDAMGNMFARREGREAGLAPVLVGSHLDTQQPGGKFDGPLGVLAGLACVRALDAAGVRTRRPVVVVNWTNEEGARFAPGLMGAAVHAGALALAEAHTVQDRGGRRVGEELRRIGFLGDGQGPATAHCYLELHIEQGDRLEKAGKTIGVVEGTENNLFLVIDCWGENAHAQATPMGQRRNALVSAAALITEAEAIGLAYAPAGSAGVAAVEVWPNNRINIPHMVRLSFSATHPTREGIEGISAAIAAAAARVTARSGMRVDVETAPVRPAVDFDAGLGEAVERAAGVLGYGTMRLRSRAGHDAIRMAPFCRSQMIFVPCKDGISHSEFEDMTQADAAAGAAVLLRVLCEEAG